MGCYFHFVKALWKRAKKLKLSSNVLLNITKNIIYILKQLPLFENADRKKFFIATKKLFLTHIIRTVPYSTKGSQHAKFFVYFEKNWLNYNQAWSQYFDEDVTILKTNNSCEIFNKKLNGMVQMKAPKLSFLESILIRITKETYNNFCRNIGSPRRVRVSEEVYLDSQFEITSFMEELLTIESVELLSNLPGFTVISNSRENYQEYIDNEFLDVNNDYESVEIKRVEEISDS
eukprot:GAHX01002098.1.p2 GENE.GAHX01002098.1~~GAHX01002098.1.p2  ORF type:complete len:232 (+),score=27.19 GAHX01002098.1:887-1582(+)